jgi:hypothetical protein
MENKSLQAYIDQYLETHKDVSAMELCTYLIGSNGDSKKLYSTGRPKIYIDVVFYLEILLKRGWVPKGYPTSFYFLFQVF